MKRIAKLFLGVDGGQSSTTALIGDETGRVLGAGVGGPCNHVGAAEGRQKFLRAMDESLGAACSQAGLDPATVRFEAACLGFSGGPEDKEPILRDMLRAGSLVVSTDAPIALAGATAGGPGIIAIGGTGSIAFGRNRAGKTARTGGWGYVYGDEGGAFDMVRQAVRAALRFDEGWGEETSLRPRLLEATGAGSAHDLLHRFYTVEYPRPRVAGYARLIDRAAEEGDAVARGILVNAAAALAGLVFAARVQLFEPGESVLACYIGGVFRSRLLLEEFRSKLEAGGVEVRPPRYGPAAGALLEAQRAAGLMVGELKDLPSLKT
jgi:N-acetylglucosamine kinase-like BadF-type ATPase